jgi:hypothetical protein
MWLQVDHWNNFGGPLPLILNPIGGNVGIGTTSPTQILNLRSGLIGNPATSGTVQTYGTARFEGNSNSVLDFGEAGGGKWWIQSTDKSGLDTNYPLLLNPNGGYVGIGTMSPAANLHIKADYPVLQLDGVGNDWDLIVGYAAIPSSSFAIYDATNDTYPFKIKAAALTNTLCLGAAGYIGIGTTEPGSKLDISSGGISGGGVLRFSDLPAAGNLLIQPIKTGGTGGWTLLSGGGGQDLFFIADSSQNQKFQINTGNGGVAIGGSYAPSQTPPSNGLIVEGGVGIGTPEAGANKLKVAGTAEVTGDIAVGGKTRANGGFVIEIRTSDPTTPETGQIWLRSNI